MPINKKRKSESVSVADEVASPAKRAAPNTPSAPPTPATPATGEKRKRGRPRKYPEGSTPKRPDGPKRGRGRPRKDPSAKDTPKSTTPKEGKRPVGRPRKFPAQNGAGSSTKLDSDGKADDDKTTYWLMKAEPESRLEKGVDVKFSIDDLREAKEPEAWDGVRNPAARNNMRAMKKGDQAFFYHSNCKVPGIAGIMEIVQEHSPDESAFDPAHPYYDEKSNRDDPKWEVVHVEFRSKLNNLITLNELKSHGGPGKALENLQMLKQTRLSVSAVTPAEWKFILGLAKEPENGESLDESLKDASADDAESSE